MTEFGATTVYIPYPHSPLRIDRGAGIVGSPSGRRLVVDVQARGSGSPLSWADRIRQASARQRAGAPTTSRMWLAHHELVEVASFDPVSGDVKLLRGQADAVSAWLGHPRDLEVELHAARPPVTRPGVPARPGGPTRSGIRTGPGVAAGPATGRAGQPLRP